MQKRELQQSYWKWKGRGLIHIFATPILKRNRRNLGGLKIMLCCGQLYTKGVFLSYTLFSIYTHFLVILFLSFIFFFIVWFFSFLDNHFDLLTTEVDFKVSIIFFCVRYFFQFEFFAFFGSFFLILGGIFRFLWSFFHGFFYNSFFVFDNLGLSFFITFLLIFC